jgi:hypothetical protein
VVLEMGIRDADGEGGEGEKAAGGTSRPVMECRQQKCFGEETRRLADGKGRTSAPIAIL